MSNFKDYRVSAADFDQAEVTLRVDHSVLTPALAQAINSLDGDGEHRLSKERGDVVATVIRLFGAHAIAYFQGDGGADISTHSQTDSDFWTQTVLNARTEGWPGCQDLGIAIKGVVINSASFYETKLETLA